MMSFFKKALSPFRRVGQETAVPTAPSIASRIAAASAVVVFALPAVGFARDGVKIEIGGKWEDGRISVDYGNGYREETRVRQGYTIKKTERPYLTEPSGRRHLRCAPHEREVLVPDGIGGYVPMCKGREVRRSIQITP